MASSYKKQLSQVPQASSGLMPDVSTWLDQVLWNDQGLVPAIAQDKQSRAVLMMAWMNREALEQTLLTGFAHYYSRSRQRLWQKGEESGHLQPVFEIRLDCDGDCVLLSIEQHGGIACHTGRESCFFNQIDVNNPSQTPTWRVILPVLKDMTDRSAQAQISEQAQKSILQRQTPANSHTDTVLQTVFATLQSRQNADPKHSYVAKLLSQGENAVLKKVGEEATELVMAVKDRALDQVVYEVADLWFHSLIALMQQGGHVDMVLAELARRQGVSGLAEFAARSQTETTITDAIATTQTQHNKPRRRSTNKKPTKTPTV